MHPPHQVHYAEKGFISLSSVAEELYSAASNDT